jgi:class 3 adenylate cyclase
VTTSPAAAESFGIRIDRSFAFIDLCGFTDFVDTNGDEAAIEQLEVLRSTVRRVASRCGVRIDKWLGDGAMVVGTQVAPLVTAVVMIRDVMGDQPVALAMRGGIARGLVILHEGDNYVGRAVNLAARLCDHAQADEIPAYGREHPRASTSRAWPDRRCACRCSCSRAHPASRGTQRVSGATATLSRMGRSA